MGIWSACMTVHHIFAWFLGRPEEGIGSPETQVREGCQLPCEGWESTLGLLEAQPVLLSTQPSLQSHGFYIKLQRFYLYSSDSWRNKVLWESSIYINFSVEGIHIYSLSLCVSVLSPSSPFLPSPRVYYMYMYVCMVMCTYPEAGGGDWKPWSIALCFIPLFP